MVGSGTQSAKTPMSTPRASPRSRGRDAAECTGQLEPTRLPTPPAGATHLDVNTEPSGRSPFLNALIILRGRHRTQGRAEGGADPRVCTHDNGVSERSRRDFRSVGCCWAVAVAGADTDKLASEADDRELDRPA